MIADDSRFLQYGRASIQPPAANRGNRQECRPSKAVRFQVLYRVARIFFRARHNVLQSAAQSRLNRGFVSLIDLQKLPDSTADAALFPVRKFQQAFHAPVKALLLPFHFQQYG